ncbi:MAG: four-carbon acid sugar kinase family protein [Saprospiraceae bacterium]|nr:four-carbon acid sugar kinase family protein [Saprospiraceae bacterium]
MYTKVKEMLNLLPPEYKPELIASIRDEFLKSDKTIIVLDDDPTGTQTCRDITVLTSWDTAIITEELKTKPSILFILTNSRSLVESEAVELTKEIGVNLNQAVKESGREIIVISRSDSTLRGHFPAEVDALAEALERRDAIRVIVPAFIEGGRYTINDVHYLVENETLVPVSETPFAKDLVFGYQQADLKLWVEEKTNGNIKATDVISISLDDIRSLGPKSVVGKINSCKAAGVCIINAVSYRDLEVVAMGMLLATKAGKNIVYRSSASFVSILAGLESGKMVTPQLKDLDRINGALIVVGSYVPKTTLQLNWLLENETHRSIEIDVKKILDLTEINPMAAQIGDQIDRWLDSGHQVVIYTSRQLEVGIDSATNLGINARVSDFLVELVKGLWVRPRFIIAKGGITSSDLVTKALGSKKARVLGPIIPGVPVWQLDQTSKFPGLMYVVFPGNVGGEESLGEVLGKLNNEGRKG